MNVVVLPSGVLFWLLIHPWAHRWRAIGPRRTYLIVLPIVFGFAAWVAHFRRWLLGTDLGTSWTLIGIAAVLFSVSIWTQRQYSRELSVSILVGIPELSPPGRQRPRLLREGIYAVVRHPRYLSAGLGVAGNALVINYAGFYFLLVFVILPLGYLLLLLEERELIGRFGDAYRTYQQDVPQFV